MSRRQICHSFSNAVRASSQPSTRPTTCIYQQVRGLKYESYEERRQAAKEWAATQGQRYMRPLKGRTNYVGTSKGKSDPSTQPKGSLSQASAGREDVEADTNPWADEKAMETLKEEHQLSEEDIHAHRQRHQGITPAILGRALSEKLEDVEIREAIQRWQSQQEDNQFDSNEAAKSHATRRMMTTKDTDPSKSQRVDPLRPFPENKSFVSQPVLSEELREVIFLKVVRDGLTVRTVSTLMGVSMERVGAVVRMKQMERDWVKHGKPLAVPYSRAVLDMIPTTPYLDPSSPQNLDRSGKPFSQPAHEPINELPVHPSTTHQTFVSVPESRQFTRADAAKAFHPHLKSTDERIPHPELLEIERFKARGYGAAKVAQFARGIVEREKDSLKKRAEAEARRESEMTKVYEGKRWNFKFQDISVEDAGRDGRSRTGTGWRYGMPHEDRKKGQVKIPTRV